MPAIEVDYRQTPESQTERVGDVNPLVIGPSMHQGFCHPLNVFTTNRSVVLETILSADTAHRLSAALARASIPRGDQRLTASEDVLISLTNIDLVQACSPARILVTG